MKKKGGSLASDRVNSLSPKECNSGSTNPTITKTNIDGCFATNNYSTIYKTTGGSIASDRVNALSSNKCASYTNFPTTDTNIDRCGAINNYSTTYKTTGGRKPKRKTKKTTKRNKTKKGGRVLMPARYFNPNNYGNYRKEPSTNNYNSIGGRKTNYSKKGGKLSGNWWPLNRSNWGDSIITGAETPKSIPQHTMDYLNGKTTLMTQKHSDPNNHTFLEKNNNQTIIIEPVDTNTNTKVNGFNDLNIKNGDTTLFKNNNIPPSISPIDYKLPMMKAGNKLKKKKGGGSDWISTVYSRGSYTSPNMSKQQFNSFNKSSPYISNIDLANGAANHFNNTPLTISNELHTPGNKIPLGYNELDSLPIKQFGKGKNKTNKNII